MKDIKQKVRNKMNYYTAEQEQSFADEVAKQQAAKTNLPNASL